MQCLWKGVGNTFCQCRSSQLRYINTNCGVSGCVCACFLNSAKLTHLLGFECIIEFTWSSEPYPHTCDNPYLWFYLHIISYMSCHCSFVSPCSDATSNVAPLSFILCHQHILSIFFRFLFLQNLVSCFATVYSQTLFHFSVGHTFSLTIQLKKEVWT